MPDLGWFSFLAGQAGVPSLPPFSTCNLPNVPLAAEIGAFPREEYCAGITVSE